MYLLDSVSICTSQFQPLWDIVGTVIKALWIGIPIALIIFGTIDLGKAVISSKEEEVKKAKKAFINRFIYFILAFAVVFIVKILLNSIENTGIAQDGTNTEGWQCCWNMALGRSCSK